MQRSAVNSTRRCRFSNRIKSRRNYKAWSKRWQRGHRSSHKLLK